MTDEQILLLFNRVIAAQLRHCDELDKYVAVEIPVGSPQVERFPGTVTEWVPRGGVPRCIIEDGDLPVIHVGDREFAWNGRRRSW